MNSRTEQKKSYLVLAMYILVHDAEFSFATGCMSSHALVSLKD